MTTPTPNPGGGDEEDITSHLPLVLLRSQIIPPSPNRRRSAIDFLPDFGGSSWIAFGASDLLVISHLPNPLSDPETLIGPSFRQVIHPHPHPADVTDDVNAVSWCPARPSSGEIAVAAGNRVFLYSPDSITPSGSFCWRQTAGILQSFTVEAIEWTGSGDGLIAVGIEVALWRRQNTSWEIAWISKAEVPQSLVSATWNAEGPIATTASLSVSSVHPDAKNISSSCRQGCTCVSVYQSVGKSGISTIQLSHPQPVTLLRWRPSAVTQTKGDALSSRREVLLTCCLDGTVRLWSEVDSGRARKYSKEIHDNKSISQYFHVVAVIEINHPMKGTLGMDIFVDWVVELGAVVSKSDGESYSLSSSGLEHDQIGKCEWLVGIGPTRSITFWAIHCLDDVNPLRFPRVTLWLKRDLVDSNSHKLCNSILPKFKDDPILVKVFSVRNQSYGPPISCSLLQLLPDNSVSWSQVYNPTQGCSDLEDNVLSQTSKEKSLSCYAGHVQNQDGHSSTILQLAIHPYYVIELACSLDSNGSLLFWSLSTISSCSLGVQMVNHPAWKLLGKIHSQDLSPEVQYLSLRWAPSVLDGNQFLLLGYAAGIDCFLIKVPGKGKSILCHKVLTVPFTDHNHVKDPPAQIFTIPLASTCGQSFFSNSFLLFAIWTKKFQALSWKVSLHSADPSGGSCGCGSASGTVPIAEKEFPSKTFYATINLGSSVFPDPHNLDHVVSFSVVSPNNSVLSIQECMAYNFSSNGYHIATGGSDGSLKLWKMCYAESISCECTFLPWELVGMFTAHHGPVSVVSLSSCGAKIATVSCKGRNNTTSLNFWEPMSLINAGSFLLEDAISLYGAVVALNWLSIGNGHLLLAVCMQNELRIYSEKRSDLFMTKQKESKEMHIWCCIALSHSYPISHDFVWGPKISPVLVHKKHFSIYNQWLHVAEHVKIQEVSTSHGDRAGEKLPCPIYSDSTKTANNVKKETGENVCTSCLKMFQEEYNSDTANRVHNLLVVTDRICGALAAYHPLALIQHLYSGNWKRAYAIVKHLVDAIKSSEASSTPLKSTGYGKSCCHNIEIQLSGYFEDSLSTDSSNKGFQWGQDLAPGTSGLLLESSTFNFVDNSSEASALNNVYSATSQKSDIVGFIDILERSYDISYFTNIDKVQILAIIDLLTELSVPSSSPAYENLDKPGRRFWVAVRFERLYSIRKFGSLAGEEFVVDSRLFAWAFQSDFQDGLLNSLLSADPSWLEMRNLGVGFWLTCSSQLRTRMEKLARLQYLKKKDPKDCALLYLALNRLPVLAGLFKISRSEKDKVLVGFLSRNFKDEKNKAAALKNAYVLMGRHQLDLAIAFFLLGGDSSSAVTVCAKNLGDEQLALIICRLIEGYGGPLEQQLISNILLPSAIEKEDYWLASLLEWTLGNYSCSIRQLLDSRMGSVNDISAAYNLAAFSDPDIGQYCVTVAAKNNIKNSIGDFSAMVLSKLATFMAVSAFKRCGILLEALENFSSCSVVEVNNPGNLLDIGNHDVFCRILNPFSSNVCNWLLADVANLLELHAKLCLAMNYISELLTNHPSWPLTDVAISQKLMDQEYDSHQDELRIAECKHSLDMVLSMFKKRYLLQPVDLTNMILVFACNKGLFFHGLRLLHCNSSQEHETDYHIVGSSMLCRTLPRLLLKAIEEITYVFTQHVVCCNLTDSTSKLFYERCSTFAKDSYDQFHHREVYLRSVIYTIRSVKPLLELCNFHASGFISSISSILDLLEYYGHLASTWFRRNMNRLLLMIQAIQNAPASDHSSLEIIAGELVKVLHQTSKQLVHEASGDDAGTIFDVNSEQGQLNQSEKSMLALPEDEMWHLIGACLWMHLSRFTEHQLSRFILTENTKHEAISSLMIEFPTLFAKFLVTSMAYISSSITKQLAFFLRHKASKGLPVTSFVWLDESSNQHSGFLHRRLNHGVVASQQIGDGERELLLQKLWEVSVNPKEVCDSFMNERIICFPYDNQKLTASWKGIEKVKLAEYESGVSTNNKVENSDGGIASKNELGSISNNRIVVTDGLLETKRKVLSTQRDLPSFYNPREVLKRKGELLEALCFNSIDEQQVAVASNKKGLVFFNWKTDHQFKEKAEYLWSESDWPQDGWAGCESTPVPTYVSQGIGLGSKRGTHLGLGGATVGLGLLARPGRDMTGGGAFGIPGYAGIGASGLGWGEQEDFEEFVDPPATVANVSSRALSRHPSRPLFLAGSSNTHIYLWEFGKERATATYGVLPAANVPPPYALASISALQFDHCGHRFATVALDGTVCTWQLEVGGRSNVHPTESSFCFNDHASDVAYVAASGSILAAAGCSSNGVNVVVWDTLAPPVTSQASLVCHEGGARSISVFDNDIGSGSISPLIVTGGESGDVGLHDFRFIATGKTKRQRNYGQQDLKSSAMHDKGMLWYIPKAHLGSVTKISTIQNTSLFLTGSKDGDVKLWDAKGFQLVYHWQKMHERHTFLQPNSRSVGGVVRAAVTDIQVLSHGFLTCGGDGSVKLVELKR